MTLTAEQIARNEIESMYDPNHVVVRVRVSWINGICIPDENGEEECVATFDVMTVGDNFIFEKATAYEIKIGEKMGSKEDVLVSTTDIHEYRRLIVKKKLSSWSLGIPIEKDSSGWMTKEGYDRVSAVSAPLMDAFVSGFEDKSGIDEEEEQKIERQCAILFSKSGRGVSDACEAVSRYCNYGSFSEKFGVNPKDLKDMSYREFLLLKIVLNKENESSRSNVPSGGNNAVQSVGLGKGKGKPTRIPMPGSGGAR
jgi:hypothetical protein